MLPNALMASGVIVASAPPAIITSAAPRRMVWNASPIEWAPAAHAVTLLLLGPVAPKRMDT